MSDDVRAYWGELPEVLGDGRHGWQAETHDRGGNVETRWQQRIAAGECPRVSCPGRLDDGACIVCGWSLLEERMRERIEAKEHGPLPELPAELTLDCFAPADLLPEEVS